MKREMTSPVFGPVSDLLSVGARVVKGTVLYKVPINWAAVRPSDSVAARSQRARDAWKDTTTRATVESEVEGRITAVLVAEGKLVDFGDSIYQIDVDP